MSQAYALGIWDKGKPQIEEIHKWEASVLNTYLRQREQTVVVRLWYLFIGFPQLPLYSFLLKPVIQALVFPHL